MSMIIMYIVAYGVLLGREWRVLVAIAVDGIGVGVGVRVRGMRMIMSMRVTPRMPMTVAQHDGKNNVNDDP
jgi:hypothetical protein